MCFCVLEPSDSRPLLASRNSWPQGSMESLPPPVPVGIRPSHWYTGFRGQTSAPRPSTGTPSFCSLSSSGISLRSHQWPSWPVSWSLDATPALSIWYPSLYSEMASVPPFLTTPGGVTRTVGAPSTPGRRTGLPDLREIRDFPEGTELVCGRPGCKPTFPGLTPKLFIFPIFKLFSATNRFLKCPRRRCFSKMNLALDARKRSQGSQGAGPVRLSERMSL